MGNDFVRSVFLFILIVVTRPYLCCSTLISTNYTVTSTNGVVNQNIVAVTFQQIRSTTECGAKCPQSASESFYFVAGSSTCHCNNVKDNTIVPSGSPGVMKYGYIGDPPMTTTAAPTTTATAVFSTCNMSAGWTVFQRRLDGSVDFFRNWVDYVNGFGNTQGEFWLGLETLHQAVAAGCELCISMEAGPNPITTQETGYAMYSSFTIGDASTKYKLTISGFTGNVGDSLLFHNNQPFSTPDNDSSSGCADAGAWWFASCHQVSLNGLYLGGANAAYGNGINWKVPWGFTYSLLKTEMAYRC